MSPLGPGMHAGEFQPEVDDRHHLAEDLGAPDHRDEIGAAPQGVAARRVERGAEARRHHDAGAAKAGRGVTTMVVRPLSGLPIDRRFRRPITTGCPMVTARKCCMSVEPPRQTIVAADDAVLGHGDDEDQGRCPAPRAAAHTATGALMCGCGS